MSSQPKALKWNPTQVKIYEMLKTGDASHHQISKELGVNISVVSKVSNAVKKGQSPATPYVQKIKKKSAYSAIISGAPPPYLGNTQQNIEKWDTTVPTKTDSVGQVAGQSSSSNYAQETATVGKLFAVPVSIPITPIMLSAKAYVIQRLHWNPDIKWEDLIDTIFYNYFKALKPQVLLQGWVEGEAVTNSPKTGTGSGISNAGGGIGTGGTDPDDPNTKDFAKAVAKALFNKMTAGATLGDENVFIVDMYPTGYS